MKWKVLHLINPYEVVDSHTKHLMDLTLQSIEEASINIPINFELQILALQNEQQQRELPQVFTQRSCQFNTIGERYNEFQGLTLPIFQDLFVEALKEDFDFLIYTNMDIILMPHFYRYIESLFVQHDAIVINRRRVADRRPLPTLAQLQAELGWSHPGFDTFVVSRDVIESFHFEEICIGVPFFESAFIHQIAAYAISPKYVMDTHLTLHVGLEILPKRNQSIYWHNRREFFHKIQPRIKAKYQLSKFPYADNMALLRAIKWMLNPSIYTRNYLKLEFNSRIKRWKMRLQALRWFVLQR